MYISKYLNQEDNFLSRHIVVTVELIKLITGFIKLITGIQF